MIDRNALGRGENQRSTAIRQVVKILKTWPAKSLIEIFLWLALCCNFRHPCRTTSLYSELRRPQILRDALNAISHEFQQTPSRESSANRIWLIGKTEPTNPTRCYLMISTSLQICISPNSYGKKVLPSRNRSH